MLGLKGSKKKKGKKLDEDWVVRALTFYAFRMLTFCTHCSQYSSPSWRRIYRKSFKLCDKPKVARFYSSF
jgi:hypothetical protein